MIFGFEALPPNVIYSIKINSEKLFVKKANHIQYLIDYYNRPYLNYSDARDTPVGGANDEITSLLNPIFWRSYKSVEGAAFKLKIRSHVMTCRQNNSKKNVSVSCLCPGQILYFF